MPKDCFVEKAKNWLWITGIITVGAVVCVIVTSSAQEPVYPSTGPSFPQGGQFRNAALTRCPYCPAFLDVQGRCNVRECPIYSPNREKSSSWQGIPVKLVLIKQLALEVGASEGKTSVVIHSIYGGGNGEKAGLQAGDRICRFNGHKVKSVKQFRSIVARAKPESNVRIQVIRGGRKITSVVIIGEGEMEGVILPKTHG
ncbi:MAG: PDZ domain-containing protein [Planctomycetota bacterium]